MSSIDSNAAPAARRIDQLPGPRGLPLLGNYFQVDPDTIHLNFEQWLREYGDPFRFSLGPRKFVVTGNPETVSTILRDRPDGFARTQRLVQTTREMGFGGVFSTNGAAWKRQRPMVLSGLDPSHIRQFFPTMAKVTARLGNRWQQAADAGEAIDLQADLMRFTVDVTAGLAFGTDINTIESTEEVIQTHLDKVLPALAKRLFFPIQYWHYFKLPSDRELDRHLTALRDAVAGFIGNARKRLNDQPDLREHPTNLIEGMVAARDREGSELSDSDVSANVLTMLLAGEDTTANTLAWMIWLLKRNPEAARRLVEEVRSVAGADGVPMKHEDLSQLDYLDACANEAMRLKPVAPVNIQQALRDIILAGVSIPAGSMVMCLMRPAAVDERHFAEADSFKPERWLTGLSASSSKRVAMPFGAGPRMCPGRYLALAEIKMAIAMLFARFDIESVATADGGDPVERLALTMSPVGLRMRLKVRSMS